MTKTIHKRERILLLSFLAALLAASGAIGWKWFSQNLRNRTEILAQKESQLQEARHWLSEKDKWQARMDWIASTPLPPYEGERTDAAFVREVQSSLAAHGVEIVDQRLQETRSSGELAEVSVDLTLNCPLENLVHWLRDTQQIGAYRTIPHLRLKSDASNSQIRAEVTLTQLYASSRVTKTATR